MTMSYACAALLYSDTVSISGTGMGAVQVSQRTSKVLRTKRAHAVPALACVRQRFRATLPSRS